LSSFAATQRQYHPHSPLPPSFQTSSISSFAEFKLALHHVSGGGANTAVVNDFERQEVEWKNYKKSIIKENKKENNASTFGLFANEEEDEDQVILGKALTNYFISSNMRNFSYFFLLGNIGPSNRNIQGFSEKDIW